MADSIYGDKCPFNARANRLVFNMWIWVVLIVAAVLTALWICVTHLDAFDKVLQSDNPKEELRLFSIGLLFVCLVFIVYFISIARNKVNIYIFLIEEYRFKSALGKAYMGFGEEFNRIAATPTPDYKVFDLILKNNQQNPLRKMERRESLLQILLRLYENRKKEEQ